jgi:hypothetical protein
MRQFKRLHITAEGHSEEKFVRDVLSIHLGNFNISADARRVLTKKDKFKSYRGGIVRFEKFKKDITNWLLEDSNADVKFSTMIDLYGLPKDFPGQAEASKVQAPYEKVKILESKLEAEINDRRFIPYIQLHEFEALVFSNPDMIKYEYYGREKEVAKLTSMLNEKGNNPELINDSALTAPSKRIESLIPEYDKVNSGVLILKAIGIDHIRNHCSHFNEWLTKLEAL